MSNTKTTSPSDGSPPHDDRLGLAAAEAQHALAHGWNAADDDWDGQPHVPTNEELADLFITSAERIIAARGTNGHRPPSPLAPRCDRCGDSRLIRDRLGADVCPDCEGVE